MIRTPSKSTVKIFLVPYDYSDMPPRHKTFLRQKTFEGSAIRDALHASFHTCDRCGLYLTQPTRIVFSPRGDGVSRVVTTFPESFKYSPLVPTDEQRGR